MSMPTTWPGCGRRTVGGLSLGAAPGMQLRRRSYSRTPLCGACGRKGHRGPTELLKSMKILQPFPDVGGGSPRLGISGKGILAHQPRLRDSVKHPGDLLSQEKSLTARGGEGRGGESSPGAPVPGTPSPLPRLIRKGCLPSARGADSSPPSCCPKHSGSALRHRPWEGGCRRGGLLLNKQEEDVPHTQKQVPEQKWWAELCAATSSIKRHPGLAGGGTKGGFPSA